MAKQQTVVVEVAEVARKHVRSLLEWGPAKLAAKLPSGKGNTWPQGSYTTRVGHRPDGTWYVDVSWRSMASHDRDHESQTCWCQLSCQPHGHAHADAADLVGLLEADLVPGTRSE